MNHRLSDQPISADLPLREVAGIDCGAVCSFIGTVRSETRGRAVIALDYEAYQAMALKRFQQIEDEARAQWPGCRVAIHHRTGRVLPGEISVVIAAAAPHRDDAFAACRHAIESLKRDAPIWKREQYSDGAVWVGMGS